MIVPIAEEKLFRDLTKGIGLSVLICLMSIYIPIIGFFCALFIPLPIIFYHSKLGRKYGLVIIAATIIAIVFAMQSVSIDLIFFAELLFLGFLLGELLHHNLSIEKIILYSSCGVIVSGLICLMVFSNIRNIGIYALASEYITENLKLAIDIYENMGVSEEHIQMISDSMEQIRYVLVGIIPALIVAFTLLVSWINLMISRPVLIKNNLYYPDFVSLNLWKAPEYLVWAVIASSVMLFFPDKVFKIAGLNFLLVLMMIYFFQGIAIVSYYFEKKRVPRTLKVFLYSLIALQHFIFLFVIGLGFFDTWLNIRKHNNT
ncbi:MAG: YybS family protein [Pseudomonadota bacterium]|nr:YybS family protein [Pseudomonadota bacterium]MBU1398870.1 YybS family protein [Pseudomonadota bacterium]MBU1569351.1 YybS family protein [Pseudomonadota bacterium]